MLDGRYTELCLVDVNDSHVSVMYGRATRTSITVVSKFPTKILGSRTYANSGYKALFSPITECLGTRLSLPDLKVTGYRVLIKYT